MLRFGTDGVRGVANLELTAEVVLALGRAAARVLPAGRFVVGRDTRLSGPLLESGLVAGLMAEGADVEVLGVAPTPAVAWIAAREGIAGAVVSASHNPFADNGVKLFGPGGVKLDDAVEGALEAELHSLLRHEVAASPVAGAEVGSIVDAAGRVPAWTASVTGSVGSNALAGMRLVVDCANGAASAVAPDVLRGLGATVEVIHADPDGTNINAACGSTHPQDLQAAVVEQGANAGVAFDGDADRVLLVDPSGALVDGDQIIAVNAIDRHDRGLLAGDAVVVTVMTNLGFRQGMEARGIGVVEVPVGDRHVLEALSAQGLELGGEQSGHVIFADLATTGDGLLTAVQTLDVVSRSGRTLSELAAAAMTRLPQVLRNVGIRRAGTDVTTALADDIAAAVAELGDTGRVLIRSSGTEPVVRVMVEAPTEQQADEIAGRLAEAVAARS